MIMARRRVAINDFHRRMGETHHNAKLTNADVEQILALRSYGLSYGAIARKFDDIKGGISKSHIRDICKGRVRDQIAAKFIWLG